MKTYLGSGKYKTAVARCHVSQGAGTIRVNSVAIDALEPPINKSKIQELLHIVGHEVVSDLDILVKVEGGGFISQANATRTAIANALTEWADSNQPGLKLRSRIIAYDRSLIVGDSRRKEIKKANAKGARAKRQKSYR